MSKNYDLIATVDIDIASPLVDDTSFDNLLIMGPAPKGEHTAPDVGAYSDISEVADAGFIVSGEGADPVGVAARVAFAQSPSPTTVYIALQKRTAEAVAAEQTIADTNAACKQYLGAREDMAGCEISFDENARQVDLVLTGPVSGVKNTNMFVMLKAMQDDGYTVLVDGTELTDAKAAKKLDVFQKISAMEQGSDPVEFVAVVAREGSNDVSYRWVVSYPDPSAPAVQGIEQAEPVDKPDAELEEPAVTIQRALGMSGWYVLCTAGIDPAKYEDIAAFIETQEKMFCYTEMGFFGAGEDGSDQPTVGNVYFRTMGIYGRVKSSQADEDVPEANPYMNVAWVAKWLNYESGSETAAFKALSSVYPSELTTTEMKAIAGANMNYFITVGNKNISMNGMTMAGEWADVIRFRDWLKNDMQVAVVNLFTTRPKVPFTDSGISLVQNQMIASLRRGQNVGGIAEDEFDEDGNTIPGFTTSVPLSSSITASEKASRKLHNCKFAARLAGAIHFAKIAGSLTYEL